MSCCCIHDFTFHSSFMATANTAAVACPASRCTAVHTTTPIPTAPTTTQTPCGRPCVTHNSTTLICHRSHTYVPACSPSSTAAAVFRPPSLNHPSHKTTQFTWRHSAPQQAGRWRKHTHQPYFVLVLMCCPLRQQCSCMTHPGAHAPD